MISKRQLFLNHVAQTSPFPMTVEVVHAEGMYITDSHGKKYMDLDSGFSVSSLGHRHPSIVNAIKTQLDLYLHTTVYGEHIQSPQVDFAHRLSTILSNNLDCIYFTTGGSEAVEIAMKLSRKFTKRFEIICCKNAYHGSTLGAESLRSDTDYTSSFMPSVPGIHHISFNEHVHLKKINKNTAGVILEVVQAEAGVQVPDPTYLYNLRKRCDEVGALLIFDEIQTGFGRTGHLFAFQKYEVTPDILLMAKAMGGGMPLGACMSSKSILSTLSINPILGHINTFGGHPLCVAAACEVLKILSETPYIDQVSKKEKLFHLHLKHPLIKEIRSSGLLMACNLADKNILSEVVHRLKENGLIVDFFLFNDESFRIAPPLIITDEEIISACNIIKNTLDHFLQH
ncbi:MAG: hypothetical protein RLZZ546_1486 [Bacteroidota bacterium]|jgi:acetylornithine/succinyldiaminopimelate/putrescine aminotransferase